MKNKLMGTHKIRKRNQNVWRMV